MPSKNQDLAEHKEVHIDEPLKFDSEMEPWLYLMKPFHKDGQELSVGLLRCTIVRSKDLPKMDTFNNDPFCRLHLTQKGGEEHKQETQVMHGKRNAVWNETFEFEVTHTLCSLHIQVRDWDKASNSDRIGVVEIPLAELPLKKKVKAWYPIALREDLKINQMKKNVKNSDKPGKERKCAAIEVELEFDFSKIGDFASHFTLMQPPAAVEQEFDMDILYANAVELQNNIWPFIELLMCINPILLWTDPFSSGLVLIVFVECCLNTWLIPIVMQLLLIRHVCWQYVLHRWQVEEDRRPKAVNKSRSDTKKQSEDALELERIKEEKRKERESHLNGFLSSVAESSLSAAKMTETLKATQNTLGFVNEWIVLVREWLSWKYPSISGAILGTLVATTLYSCFFPFAYVALVVGVIVLCIFTVPMAVLIWLISGTAFYATQRAYIFAEFIEGVQEKFLQWRKGEADADADANGDADEKKGDADDEEKADADADKLPIDESSDSEYTMVGSDDEDEDSRSSSHSDSDSDPDSDTGEDSRRKSEGKPSKKRKRKRGFLKRLFSISENNDDKEKPPKDADAKGAEKAKSAVDRRASASASPSKSKPPKGKYPPEGEEMTKAKKFGTI